MLKIRNESLADVAKYMNVTVPPMLVEICEIRDRLIRLENEFFLRNEDLAFDVYNYMSWIPIEDCCCCCMSDVSTCDTVIRREQSDSIED